MGTETSIAWCDHTFSPWWGCQRVSAGCQHCYAETFAHRLGLDIWGKNSDRQFFGDNHWENPAKWNRAAQKEGRRHRVFCASMADVFERTAEPGYYDQLDEQRVRLFDLIEDTPWLDWQLLTKRPENVMRMVPPAWWTDCSLPSGDPAPGWPANAWIGTTVEDQDAATARIPTLLKIPAPIRFLSCEPLLGELDIDFYGIDWVIVGGESGPKRRPMDLGWMLDVVEQARGGPAVFIKQDSALRSGEQGRIPDRIWALKQFPRSAG